ncbi:MAG: gliding motility-associated C-terminal domain-containing protein, partial [Flavobacteriales bacterium]
DNKDAVWEGKDKNENALNDGTYFYIIRLKDKGAQKSGWVQIMK